MDTKISDLETTENTDYTDFYPQNTQKSQKLPRRRSRQFPKGLFSRTKIQMRMNQTASCGSAVVMPLRGAFLMHNA